MKSILIIGSLNSVHIYNYIKNVIVDIEDQYAITIFNQVSPLENVKKEYIEFYTKNNIRLVGGGQVRNGRLLYMLKTYKILKSLGHFDIVHVHYVSHYLAPILYLLRRNYAKIILTYWGSDILRSSKFTRSITYLLVKKSDKLTFTTEDTLNYFLNIDARHLKFEGKTWAFDFGNMFLDDINNQLGQSKEKIKADLGLNYQKTIIAIGYCGRVEMQQVQSIKSLFNLSQDIKDQIQILLPTVGMDSSKEQEVKTILSEGGFDYKIISGFLGPLDIAKLRIASDIFIHPQTTDALSSSVLEHLYAGSILVNAAWLNYGSLNTKHVYYETFDSFDGLASKISSILHRIDEAKKNAMINHSKIEELASWKNLKDKWISLYQ